MAEVMKPEGMIWTNLKDTSGIKVSSVKKEIPKHIAERASLLWARMLIRAEFQKGYSYPDAQFYCFFKLIPYWGTLGGECVFRNGTRSSMLAGIGLLLEDYVNATSNDEQKIASEIESLMENLDAAQRSDTSVEQEGKFHAVTELLKEQAKDAEHDRLWSEKKELEYRKAREAALAEMRKTAVRYGKTGFWDKEDVYRPYP